MRSGIRKITYHNSSDTYLIATEDKERCGYPLSASPLLNKEAYLQLKVRMRGWSQVTFERVGCLDIITGLERKTQPGNRKALEKAVTS